MYNVEFNIEGDVDNCDGSSDVFKSEPPNESALLDYKFALEPRNNNFFEQKSVRILLSILRYYHIILIKLLRL